MIKPLKLYSQIIFDIQCSLPDCCKHDNCFIDGEKTIFNSGDDIIQFIYDYAVLNDLIVGIPDHFYDMVMKIDKDQKYLHLGPSHIFFIEDHYRINFN